MSILGTRPHRHDSNVKPYAATGVVPWFPMLPGQQNTVSDSL